MRRALLIVPALALAPLANAFAQVPRTVQLEYERQEGASSCPDYAAVRTGVAARLGYDPVADRADDHLRATIRKTGRALEARIELTDAQGKLKAQRRLISRDHDCAELAAAVELAIAIAIDPVGSRRPMAEPAATSVAEVPADVPPEPGAALPPVLASSPRRPMATRLDVGALAGIGFAPAVNLGVRVGAALQGELVSLGLEVRADLPSSQAAGQGRVSAALLVASVVPCAHVGMASGCFLVTAGAQRVAGEGLDQPRRATLPYLGLGVRLGLSVPIGTQTSLAFHGDMIAPITEARLMVDDVKVVWTSPTVAVALGIGLAMRFP